LAITHRLSAGTGARELPPAPGHSYHPLRQQPEGTEPKMSEHPVYLSSLFAPIRVEWSAERSELAVIGTIQLGADGPQRSGLLLSGAAAQELMQQMRSLLAHVDEGAIGPRPRDLQ